MPPFPGMTGLSPIAATGRRSVADYNVGGDWHAQPQNWALKVEPRPLADPTSGSPLGTGGGWQQSVGLSPAQAALAGELAGAGAMLGLAGTEINDGKLGDVGRQGMSPDPGPPSDPAEWVPFTPGAAPPPPPPPAPAAKPAPSSPPPAASTSGPPTALIALGALGVLAVLLS